MSALAHRLEGAARLTPPTGLLQDFLRRDRTLTLLGLGLWLAILPAAAASLIDPRTLDGADVWLKPIKFMASVGLFALTKAWFVGELPPARRHALPVRLMVWTVVVTSLFEIAYITLQAGLGERSHFKVDTAFHGVLYGLMGIGAVLLTLTPLLLAWELRRHGLVGRHPAFRRAALLGLSMTAVLGIASGAALSLNGSHAVGGPADTPGLPLFGWSFTLGDLRVAHFFALHAEQILPLAAVALLALWPRRAKAGVGVAAALLAALVGATLLQALAGQPFLTP